MWWLILFWMVYDHMAVHASSPRLSADGDPLPFRIPWISKFTIESRFSRLSELSVPTRISLSNNVVIHRPSRRVSVNQDRVIDVLLNRDDWEVPNTFFARYIGTIMEGPESVEAMLGVGPSSALVVAAESVAITRNELVLGESLEWFASSCVNTSFAEVPILSGNESMSYVMASIEGERTQLRPHFFSPFDSGFVVSVSENLGREIYEIFESSGAVRTNDSNQFTLCQSDLLQSMLPEITVNLYGDNGLSIVARIEIPAEDYVEFLNNESSGCVLKFKILRDGEDHLDGVFDPLMLADVNIRISEDRMWICDSAG